MLVHKFFRALDVIELSEGGTLIDAVNRAEKRGIIHSAKEVRALKDLRNDIAHEYPEDRLKKLQKEVFEAVPNLLEMVSSSITYAQKYL